MAEQILRFVNLPQQMPEKRGVAERRHDFGEIYKLFEEQEAAVSPAGAASAACRSVRCIAR